MMHFLLKVRFVIFALILFLIIYTTLSCTPNFYNISLKNNLSNNLTEDALVDISTKASKEAAASGKPVEYRTTDGRGVYRADPLDYDSHTKCRKVHERAWEDGKLILDRIKNICEGIDKSKPILEGSGFLLSKTGLVVTNYHIVQDTSNIEVLIPEKDKIIKASILLKDPSNDIAILKLTDFNYPKMFSVDIPLIIVQSYSVKVGQDVFTLGFPLGDILGKSVKFSSGKISSLFGILDDPRLFQISNPIQPGNSGGPLFNKDGEIIGIVVASLNVKYFYEKASIVPQNVNFAIKSDYLLNLISMLPENDEIKNRYNSLKGKSLEEQVENIKPYVVTIIAR